MVLTMLLAGLSEKARRDAWEGAHANDTSGRLLTNPMDGAFMSDAALDDLYFVSDTVRGGQTDFHALSSEQRALSFETTNAPPAAAESEERFWPDPQIGAPAWLDGFQPWQKKCIKHA